MMLFSDLKLSYITVAVVLPFLIILFVISASLSLIRYDKDQAQSSFLSRWTLGHATIFGLVHSYRKGNFLSHASVLFRRFGENFKLSILTQDIIFTCDPYNIDFVLVHGLEHFAIGPLRRHLFSPVMPHSIFNLDGQEWRNTRRLLRTQFSQDRAITDLERQEHHFRKMVALISKEQGPVDLQEIFMRLLTDTTSEFALGYPLGSLDPAQGRENKEMEEALLACKETIAQDGIKGPLRWLGNRKRWLRSCGLIKSYIEAFATEAMDSKACIEDEQGASLGYKFVQQLARHTDDLKVLRDQTTTLIFAGVDPVASLLSSTFWLLSRNSRVLEKLRSGILDCVGKTPPTYDQLKQLVYLRHVLNEAMRMYPPVPFNARVAMKDILLPRGGEADGLSNVFVKKGSIIFFSAYASHRRKAVFGENAEEFIPERWETLGKSRVPGFLPFQLGPRNCPGQRFGLTVASYVTVRMLQMFKGIESCDGRQWKERLSLNLESENGVLVSLWPE